MASLQKMLAINFSPNLLARHGALWLGGTSGQVNSFSRAEAMQFGSELDAVVASAIAHMLGGLPVTTPNRNALLPSSEDEVECGPFRVVGGVRSQNFDVGYRPDGVRIAFDSKTLNDKGSIRKNYQNMINDLAATTVHTRFPYAVVGFIVALPEPAMDGLAAQERAIVATLERMTLRRSPLDIVHKAEAIALVFWDPRSGAVNRNRPDAGSPLRVERFAEQVEAAYIDRYKGLPPHDVA